MSDLDSTLVPGVLAACAANSTEAAKALSRLLESELALEVDPAAATYAADSPPEWSEGGGLAIALEFGNQGMLVLLPEGSHEFPDWVSHPDATGTGKLNKLAEELASLLVPDSLVVDDFWATWLPNLAEGIARCELAQEAPVVTLNISGDDKRGAMHLVWPCAAPRRLVPEAEHTKPQATSKPATSTAAPQSPPTHRTRQLAELPPYARHLLKIKVPVMVNLVSKKQSIEEIMELGPGAIINFEKSCDDPLELMVGNRLVALGSALKVGDKFGIEITEISLPEESFGPVVIPRVRAS